MSMPGQRTEPTLEPMLLTARHAAKVLRISERTLWTLTKTRHLGGPPRSQRSADDRSAKSLVVGQDDREHDEAGEQKPHRCSPDIRRQSFEWGVSQCHIRARGSDISLIGHPLAYRVHCTTGRRKSKSNRRSDHPMFETRSEPTIEPMLLTVRQAAKVLSISERTLWTLTKTGAIPAVRFGGRNVRYDPADLRRWIEHAKNSEKSA
jgi:excisionase family DNA binding protein